MAGTEKEVNNAFEPGAAQFGNFINYYDFNPPSNRLALFQGTFCDFFPKNVSLVCLDVGCNTGELTRGMHEMLSAGRAVRMLGVDLDEQLVQRAGEMSRESQPEFRKLDFVGTESDERDELLGRYLDGQERFDIAFCFSTTMWVHLNYGDAGLHSLLASLARWADNVVIEPQPWKCYRNAARRLRRTGRPVFPMFDTLVHRSDVIDHIERVLQDELGMRLHAHLGHSEWNRPVLWYRHQPPS